MRGSDPDAALYWLARMLEGGEDPLYIARRLVRMAVEDIGLADPQALLQALAAKETYEFLGSPGRRAGDRAVHDLHGDARPNPTPPIPPTGRPSATARETGSLMPPTHILNAPTKLMKGLGYGKGYEYDHDTAEGFSGQNYFPDGMPRQQFYRPPERGFEREIRKRLEYWSKLRAQKSDDPE